MISTILNGNLRKGLYALFFSALSAGVVAAFSDARNSAREVEVLKVLVERNTQLIQALNRDIVEQRTPLAQRVESMEKDLVDRIQVLRGDVDRLEEKEDEREHRRPK